MDDEDEDEEQKRSVWDLVAWFGYNLVTSCALRIKTNHYNPSLDSIHTKSKWHDPCADP